MEQEQIKKLNNMCNVAYEVQLGTMLNEMSQGEGAQSDWDETDETSTAYIKNKPDMIGKKAENAVNCEIFNNTETNEVEEGSTNSHVEGRDNTVGSDASHAEGRMCKAVGENSHAENYYAQALGMHSHAEGSSTIAKGNHAHVEGACNEANGMDSHAEGRNSVAEGMFQHVQGKANIVDYEEKYLHIVGNGSDINHRSNAHTIDWHGNGWFQGVLKVGGTGQEDENAVEVATVEQINAKANVTDFDELKNKVAKISEAQTTKNLFDSDILLGITDCAKVGEEYSFTAANAKNFGTVFSDFEPDKIYTLSFMAKVSHNSSTGNGLVFQFEYTDAKRNVVAIPNTTTEWTKFSLSSDGRTISALALNYNNGGANVWELKEIQLEVGKNATEYVPYGGITAVDKTAREEIAKSLKSGEITISDTSQYSSFDELPVNTIVNILPSVKLNNAPDGYQYVGHNISDTGKYNATVLTYSAYKTVIDGVVQMCIFYNADYELSKQPRMAVRYGIKKDETIEWSDWSTMSNDSCLHSSNRVVDVNSYSEFTFDDFNDAPVNAIYQVDLNCADVIKNNPSPGHSGLLITYAFSPITRHALVQHHYALENGNIAMYIRYSYKNAPNDFRWTQWQSVATINSAVGKKGTGENAEIFNDMTNIATGEYSHAEGYNTRAISNNSSAHGKSTIAGSKAFKITTFDDSTKTYTLDSVEGLAVGDVFSLKLKNNYENYGKITAITDNVVTVDNYVAQETEGDDLFRIVAKPEIGTVDFGMGAFVEGESNKATGENSHAEGKGNTSYGKYAHTEGKGNSASYAAHAEGVNTNATGFCSHTEGQDTIATNYTSHAEGTGTEATGYTAHAEGNKTKSQGPGSHAEGSETVAGSACSHAEGEKTKAMGANSHTEGKETEAIGDGAHAEGMGTVAVFNYQHVEGKYNIKDNSSSGKYVHIVGNGYSDTTRSNAHTIDWNGVGWFKSGLKIGGNGQDDTAAVEVATKIDIDNTIGRKGTGENAEIFNDYTNNQATGAFSHAEGSYTKAIGYVSHTEGIGTTASEAYAHAEGISTTALAANSHAEGNSTHAEGNDSHAEGYLSTAKQRAAHAEGEGTIANGEAQHAEGKYNIEDTENKYAHIVGNGYFDGDQSKTFRSNAHTVDWSGNSWYAGSIKIGGSGYEDTKAKTVATVNDIETKITSTIGDVSSLLTEDKTTLVSIIQDLVTRVTALENKA